MDFRLRSTSHRIGLLFLGILSLWIIGVAGAHFSSAQAALPGKNGPLLFNSFFESGERPLAWSRVFLMEPNGKLTRLSPSPNVFWLSPALAPFNNRLAFESSTEVWVGPVSSLDRATQVTDRLEGSGEPVFAPGGNSLLYSSSYDSRWGPPYGWSLSEYRLATGEHRVLIDSFASWFSPDPAVSPDGRLLAYETTFQDDQTNTYEDATIWLIRRGDRVKWEFPVPYNARSAEFSPDGKKILHLGEIDGKWQVMLANLDGTDQQQLTFDDANKDSPKFSPDGKAIAYRTHPGPSILVIQDLSSGNTREFSLPGWGSELTEWTRQFPFKASRYMFKPRTINIRTFNPGNLHIAGKNIKKTSRRLATPGKTTISIRWTGKRKKNKIQQTTLRIRFKPDGSIPTTQTRQARR